MYNIYKREKKKTTKRMTKEITIIRSPTLRGD